jgi:SAM-dependent methyltransferase
VYDREQYWSAVAGRIAQRVTRRDVAGDDDAYSAYKRRKMLNRFLASLPVTGKTVLELGCGPGGNLEYLLNKGAGKLIGVDISATMLGLAGERLGETVTLLKTDGQTIVLPDDSVDLAYTVTVLQHNVEDAHMRAMVAELARVSRGSVVLIEDLAAPDDATAGGDSWVMRPLREYEDAARAVGLRLQTAVPLQTRISRNGWWRIGARFRSAAEGGQNSRLFHALVAAWVGIARHLDDRVRDDDLTKMVFTRC